MAIMVLVLVLAGPGWTTAPFLAFMLVMGLVGGFMGERIELAADAVSFRRSGQVMLTVPCRAVASLRFSANELVVLTEDGTEITLTTAWYTGRQRDAMVAHLRRA